MRKIIDSSENKILIKLEERCICICTEDVWTYMNKTRFVDLRAKVTPYISENVWWKSEQSVAHGWSEPHYIDRVILSDSDVYQLSFQITCGQLT